MIPEFGTFWIQSLVLKKMTNIARNQLTTKGALKMKLQILTLLLFSSACVTTPSKSEFVESKVIERIGNKSKTPEWASGEIAMYEEKGNVIFINTSRMQGNARPEACLKATDLDARTSMLRHIKDSITSSGMVEEASVSDDPSYSSLSAYLAQGSISAAKIESRYWERVEESDADSGERVLRLHCAVKLAVKKSELSRQLAQAMGSGGNPEIRKKLIDAQKNFIDGLSTKSDSNSEEMTH